MEHYHVAELFVSVNGEGVLSGQLSVFVRFCGCNLNCSYCDTKWANQSDTPFQIMTEQDICEYIQKSGIRNVTITGGEPLLQPNIDKLLRRLSSNDTLRVEIETNGSIDIGMYQEMDNAPAFTMDYKLPSSGMERYMCRDAIHSLQAKDTVKFVCGTGEDLERARELICEEKLTQKCHVYLSPVYGQIDLKDMVDYMKKYHMNDVNLQMQLHKIIWDPNERGV